MLTTQSLICSLQLSLCWLNGRALLEEYPTTQPSENLSASSMKAMKSLVLNLSSWLITIKPNFSENIQTLLRPLNQNQQDWSKAKEKPDLVVELLSYYNCVVCVELLTACIDYSTVIHTKYTGVQQYIRSTGCIKETCHSRLDSIKFRALL